MRRSFEKFVLTTLLNIALFVPAMSQQRTVTADSVKTEFLHAWNAYKQYAWGHDALKPLTKQPHDWYGTSLYMTPVDAYDVMLLMGGSRTKLQRRRSSFSTVFHSIKILKSRVLKLQFAF